MANGIIDEDTRVFTDYRQLIKNPKQKPVWTKYFLNEVGRISLAVGYRVEGRDTIFFCSATIYLKTEGNM